jgi:hypothetical protein
MRIVNNSILLLEAKTGAVYGRLTKYQTSPLTMVIEPINYSAVPSY